MKFVFWQNCPSIHQIPMIRLLAQKHEVVLMAEKELSSYRKSCGWTIPEAKNFQLFMKPTEGQIRKLLDQSADAIHIVVGFHLSPLLRRILRENCRRGCKVLVFSESARIYATSRLCRYLRHIRTWLDAFSLRKRIGGVLAVGEVGTRYFSGNGFTRKTFEFAYFPECAMIDCALLQSENMKPKLIFIGSIDSNKNILLLVSELLKRTESFDHFTIIGDGPLAQELDDLISVCPQMTHIPRVPNAEISRYICQNDILLLPSLWDGWGAVVSEALLCGTRVICSEYCGAETLIRGNRGTVFSFGKGLSLAEALDKELSAGKNTPERRKSIQEWAEDRISPQSGVQYLKEILGYLYEGREFPLPPWKR